MSNGRCRMHGGSSTGAPKGNTNNLKHGIYRAGYTEDEVATLEIVDESLGDLKQELRMARTMLGRTWILYLETKSNPMAGMQMGSIRQKELRDRQYVNKDGATITISGGSEREVTQKMPDLLAILDKQLARVAYLEMIQSNLDLYGTQLAREKYEEMARELQEMMVIE